MMAAITFDDLPDVKTGKATGALTFDDLPSTKGAPSEAMPGYQFPPAKDAASVRGRGQRALLTSTPIKGISLGDLKPSGVPPKPPGAQPGYMQESLGELKKLPSDIYEGGKETVTGAPGLFRKGEETVSPEGYGLTGALKRTIARPLAGAYAAASESPAGQFLFDLGAASGFTLPSLSETLPKGGGGAALRPRIGARLGATEEVRPRAAAEEPAARPGAEPPPPGAAPGAAPETPPPAGAPGPKDLSDAVSKWKEAEAKGDKPATEAALREVERIRSGYIKGEPSAAPTGEPAKPPLGDQGHATASAKILDDVIREGKAAAPGSKEALAGRAAEKMAASRLSPRAIIQTLSSKGLQGARALIRQQIGLGERSAQQAVTELEPFQLRLNQMSEPDRLKFMAYVEGRSGEDVPISPDLKPAADAIRKVNQEIATGLLDTNKNKTMNVITDYLRHEVRDPKKLERFMNSFGTKAEGSARGATKKRKYPTVSDLLEAGHELKNSNPIEVTMGYANHMSRYIAAEKAYDIAREQGTIKFFTPGREPKGWVPIEGRHGGRNVYGKQPYAPAEFSKDWNNFVGEGFKGMLGDIIGGARAVTNMFTAAKLFGGYHALTMSAASITSEMGRAIDAAAHGRPWSAAKAAANVATIIGPIMRDIRSGVRGQRAYLGKEGGIAESLAGKASPEEQKIIDILTQVNFRPKRLDPSISITPQGSLIGAFRQGALKPQMQRLGRNIAEAKGGYGARKGLEAGKSAFNLVGRTLDTMSAPLFKHVIPALKTGAAMANMREWLASHPTASFEETIGAATKIADNMDDRFGEMNQTNLFWPQKVKEVLQTSMISYSWTVGIARALGGGAGDIGKFVKSKVGFPPKVGDAEWTSRASYAIAFPIVAAQLGAVYQYMKTGTLPKNLGDAFAPLTGGTVPATKHKDEVDEKALIPGHMKDVYDIIKVIESDNPARTLSEVSLNKVAPILRTVNQLIVNRDWEDHPIRNEAASAQDQVSQSLSFLLEQISPISILNIEEKKEGSGLNLFERIVGIKPAPSFIQDPTGYGNEQRYFANEEWKKKLQSAENAARAMGNDDLAGELHEQIKETENAAKRLSRRAAEDEDE
jgi:hypothetical protein